MLLKYVLLVLSAFVVQVWRSRWSLSNPSGLCSEGRCPLSPSPSPSWQTGLGSIWGLVGGSRVDPAKPFPLIPAFTEQRGNGTG